MSLHNTLHFIPKERKRKRNRGLFSVLHCSSPLSTSILQSCSVILQNVPLMSARVLISICILFAITTVYVFMYVYQQPKTPSVSSLLHYRNRYHTFTFACTSNCPVYHLYDEFFHKSLRLVNHATSPITTNEAVQNSFTTILTKCFNNTKHHY